MLSYIGAVVLVKAVTERENCRGQDQLSPGVARLALAVVLQAEESGWDWWPDAGRGAAGNQDTDQVT